MVLNPITITAADVQLGPLTIMVLRPAQEEITTTDPETGEEYVAQEARPALLRFKRTYRMVDEAGEIVRELPAREIKRDVPLDQIPADIRQALVAIDGWTRTEAREDAGLIESGEQA
jgi:hypothetical protein